MQLTLGTFDLIVIIAMLAGSVFVGMYASKKINNSGDFAVASRSLGLIVSFATISATMTGGFTVMGQQGMAYTAGVSSLWMTISWAIGWSVLALMSKRVHDTGASSLPNIFERRFGQDTAKVSGFVSMIYVIGTTSAQLAATGSLIKLIFPALTFTNATIIGAIIIILYTVMGGLYAVAYNDTFHFLILALALGILVPILSVGHLEGGIGVIKEVVQPEFFDMMNGYTATSVIALCIAYAFSATSNASLLQRTLAAKDSTTAAKSHWYAMIWYFIVTGTLLISVFAGKVLLPNLEASETIVPALVVAYFPAGLKGLTIAALLAVVMSTADSYLLIAGTTTANDIIKLFKPSLTDDQLLKISRIATVAWGIVAVLLAVKFKFILYLFSKTAALYAAGMFFPLICTIYWKRASKQGIIWGMLSGVIVSAVWMIAGSPFGLNSILIGGPASGLATLLVSKLTYKESEESIDAEEETEKVG